MDLEEIKKMIAHHEQESSNHLQQTNFHAGVAAGLKAILEMIEKVPETEAPEGEMAATPPDEY